MNATDQATTAEALEASGARMLQPTCDPSGNVRAYQVVPWPKALVMIARGETRDCIVAMYERAEGRPPLKLVKPSTEGRDE